MKRTTIFQLVIAATLLFTACHKSEDRSSEVNTDNTVVALDMVPPPPPVQSEALTASLNNVSEEDKKQDESGKMNEQYNAKGTADATRVAIKIPEKIKKTADINITVDNYKKARQAIENIVHSGHAYISGENEQNSTYNISDAMIIRVMNKDFDSMVSNIAAIDGHVNTKNIYMEDVTAEFVDITARLKSKKEIEQRYLDLLQKAIKVSDILEVEEQLRVVREEIEAKEGELKYLNDQVDYSTINLNFHQDFEYIPTDSPGFFGRMGTAFGNGWNGFLSFLIGIVYAWPLWIILSVGGWFLYRFIKKLLKK